MDNTKWVKLGKAARESGLSRRLLLQLAGNHHIATGRRVAQQFGVGRNWHVCSEWVAGLCDAEAAQAPTRINRQQPTTRELGRRMRRRHQYERQQKLGAA